MEAEIGFMMPKVKKQLDVPEAGRGKEGPPLEFSEKEWLCQNPDFGIPALWTVKQCISIALKDVLVPRAAI